MNNSMGKEMKKNEADTKVPAKQGEYEVGDKHPPKEHQFKPGQSGNPKGPPVRRTHLWVWLCEYMGMTDARLAKVKTKRLTQVQQAAIVLVENFKAGKFSKSSRLMRYIVDREEGKALETIKLTGEEPLSADECEDIREILRENGSID